jgi:hypothetical protein
MVLMQRKNTFDSEELTMRCGVYVGNSHRSSVIVIIMRGPNPYSPGNVRECILLCPIIKKKLTARKKPVLTWLYLPQGQGERYLSRGCYPFYVMDAFESLVKLTEPL